MARPRSAGFELQREQMLAAAAQLFATRGYTAATMQDVATACGVSKATLYHYVRDKHQLLAQITQGHVARLEELVTQVQVLHLPPDERLQALIQRFMQAYASAAHEHRVLTEDVKFLADAERQAVLDGQRRVVASFADAIAGVRPDLQGRQLDKPLAMLLFGMINWTFTWLRADGLLTHASLAPLVQELFLGGLAALSVPSPASTPA
ncbi:MAG: TetR/AcrR family transcriptional regulator [Rubrivivax sp.]|nr:TetR/AcrR family transcriptional regulator [Rubrivivax sp.]